MPGGLTLDAVAAGNVHSCGLATDDTLACWGDATSAVVLNTP